MSEQSGLPPGSFILQHDGRVLASSAQIALSSLLHSNSPIVSLEHIQSARSPDPPDEGSSTRKVGNASTNTLLRDSAETRVNQHLSFLLLCNREPKYLDVKFMALWLQTLPITIGTC